MSIYYQKEDGYLIDRLEKEANCRRKSKSAMILSILEEYFEANKRIGEILRDMRAIENGKLEKALKVQQEEEDKRLGEIMVERDYVKEDQLHHALQIQANGNGP